MEHSISAQKHAYRQITAKGKASSCGLQFKIATTAAIVESAVTQMSATCRKSDFVTKSGAISSNFAWMY